MIATIQTAIEFAATTTTTRKDDREQQDSTAATLRRSNEADAFATQAATQALAEILGYVGAILAAEEEHWNTLTLKQIRERLVNDYGQVPSVVTAFAPQIRTFVLHEVRSVLFSTPDNNDGTDVGVGADADAEKEITETKRGLKEAVVGTSLAVTEKRMNETTTDICGSEDEEEGHDHESSSSDTCSAPKRVTFHEDNSDTESTVVVETTVSAAPPKIKKLLPTKRSKQSVTTRKRKRKRKRAGKKSGSGKKVTAKEPVSKDEEIAKCTWKSVELGAFCKSARLESEFAALSRRRDIDYMRRCSAIARIAGTRGFVWTSLPLPPTKQELLGAVRRASKLLDLADLHS